jgi:hypothetical protein
MVLAMIRALGKRPRDTLVKIINHVLNLEIDKFKLAHGRIPSCLRLGRKQLASLLELDEEHTCAMAGPVNYREIPVEAVDEEWHLAVG